MTQSTKDKTPTASSVQGPAGPSTEVDPAQIIRPKSLTAGNRLPKWFMPAVLAGAAVLGAAISSAIGFTITLWLILTAILYVIGVYTITRIKVGPRKATDMLWRNLVYIAFVLALIPLVSVIYSVSVVGFQGLTNPGFLTSEFVDADGRRMRSSVDQGTEAGEHGVMGGIAHALVGSLAITLTATIISVPIGLLTSIYLVEYARGGPLSRGITFFVDVMTGIPSIVAGLFGAAAMVFFLGIGNSLGLPMPSQSRMGLTAAVALCVLMIPVVVRTTEEMLRVVPNELREASYALGVRKWRTILKVVIPTAISGIAAGVTLAVARVIGETAPILITAGMTEFINWNMVSGWMATLPVFIYEQFTRPTDPNFSDPSHQRAWGAALVLIMIVMTLNLIARLVAHFFAPKKTGR
ncbi:phosphate ABC transporter permease PstA [Nesterenkonia sp. MY13]|uniref:Phosphate transport system permease protein PstA n=1 Tax=Nesterenkonia sedimenti TaxID=1463632 RepID=A0A7X8TJA1_9MICC|nr:phosphate ABC transporter permease PstA [Nesterenkonia sedimenti]NLS09783.1 phosphate ABC transporter permease PstA [Nesterenkonia sedimenti]